MKFEKSVEDASFVSLETLKRIILVTKESFLHILIFALALSLANRIIIYVLMPEAIGLWSLDYNQLNSVMAVDPNKLDPFKVFLTLPTILQYPLFAAMIHYANNRVISGSGSLLESIKIVFKKIHIIIFTAILYALIIGAGLVCFILPGLYFMGMFSMAIPSIVIDNKGIISSLKYSKEMTHKSVLYVLFVILLSLVIPNVVSKLVGMSIANVIPNVYINELVIVTLIAFSTCILASAFVFSYNELSLRRDERAKLEQEEMATEEEPIQ
ncbi:MAG: hypothetical protein VX335_04180 [Pseudomonadota bacterium]|nr:hypothetical protein [Pseudomonadota bacterium]